MKRSDTIRRVDLHIIMMLVGVFVASQIIAGVLGPKLFTIGGVAMTAGILTYPITFMVTDVANEVWGKSVAKRFVGIGIVTQLFMALMFKAGIWLPPASVWGDQVAFQTVLGSVPRMVIAGIAAFSVSQTWDVWVFHLIKEKSKLGLWFRNNLSTITSQVLDSAIFLVVAFWGVVPAKELWVMFVAYIAVKAVIALLDTPFTYAGVHIAQKLRGER